MLCTEEYTKSAEFVANFWYNQHLAGKSPALENCTMNDIIIETEVFRLVLTSDGLAQSLVIKTNGEELLEAGEGIPFCTTTQDRPFNNEIKLVHPNKRTTYPANRIRRDGDRLVIGFETAPYEAVVEVRTGKGFSAFTLADWIVKLGAAGYAGYVMDSPPVADFRLVQLPVRHRANLGDWLNSAWDERGGVAVLAADPYVDADHEERARCRLLNADLHRGIELLGGTAVVAVGVGGAGLLAAVEEVEEAFDLPRGVAARRSDKLNASIYWTYDANPSNIDEHIAIAKRGGFRMMLIYYTALFKCPGGYGELGDYDWRDDQFPNGAEDLRRMLDKIKAAGITPGFHTLQTHIGLNSRYVTPVADPRLNLTRRFTLMRAIPAEGDVGEIFVAENPVHAMRHERARVLRFGGELFSYEDYATEPPYRFTGVKRGFAKTASAAHEAGEGGGTLDISEFGATSCYIDQSTDLQDEVGAKIAEVFDAGMEFCYFDGSEGVSPPCNITVSLSQWRVCRRFKRPPLFTEGAAKSHFGWHLQAGANAFDKFRPEVFKEKIIEFPFAEAPEMRKDFTRVDFGWWGMWLPGKDTVGLQADMWEFGTSKAAAWDCPATIQVELAYVRAHPRMGDILETMRRWEDVRTQKWLTDAQKEMLKDPNAEYHLYLNAASEYELVRWEEIPDVCGGQVRAFVFERGGERYVAYWHVSGEGTMLLPDESKLIVGDRRYWRSGLSVNEVKDLFSRAVILPA